MVDFEVIFYRTSGQTTVAFDTPEQELLMAGCQWRPIHDGVAIYDMRKDFLGNLKPSYPNHEKVYELTRFFLKNYPDERLET